MPSCSWKTDGYTVFCPSLQWNRRCGSRKVALQRVTGLVLRRTHDGVFQEFLVAFRPFSPLSFLLSGTWCSLLCLDSRRVSSNMTPPSHFHVQVLSSLTPLTFDSQSRGGTYCYATVSGNIKSTLKNMSRNVTIGRHWDDPEVKWTTCLLLASSNPVEVNYDGLGRNEDQSLRLVSTPWTVKSRFGGGNSPEVPCVKLYAAVDSSAVCDYSNKRAAPLAVIMCFDGDVTRCSFSTNVPQGEGTSRRVSTTWSSSESPVVCRHEAPWMKKKKCGETLLSLPWAQHCSGIHVFLILLVRRAKEVSSNVLHKDTVCTTSYMFVYTYICMYYVWIHISCSYNCRLQFLSTLKTSTCISVLSNTEYLIRPHCDAELIIYII